MYRKPFRPEQIISKLREAKVLISQGATIAKACRKLGITDQTYYRWRKEYGGIEDKAQAPSGNLEKENARLKKLVADISLDNAILKEAAGESVDRPGDARW